MNKLIGYVYGYKSTRKNVDNSYSVTFNRCIAFAKDGYPEKFKKEKDFYCIRVREGDTSELHASKDAFLEFACAELFTPSNISYVSELFDTRQGDYPLYLTKEAFHVYSALKYAQMMLEFEHKAVDPKWLEEVLQCHDAFKSDTSTKIAECLKCDILVYEKELAQALS